MHGPPLVTSWYFLPDTVHLLPGFQSHDDEDGSPVHAAHTAAVAHKVVQDGGKLSPHLKTQSNDSHHSVDAGGFQDSTGRAATPPAEGSVGVYFDVMRDKRAFLSPPQVQSQT